MYSDESATIEINGGKFTSPKAFILTKGITLVINDGWFENANGTMEYWSTNGINVTVNGGVFANGKIVYEYSSRVPIVEEILGSAGECELMLAGESGNEYVFVSLSDYIDGVVFVAHKGATVVKNQDGHALSCPSCEEQTVFIKHHSYEYEVSIDDETKHTVICGKCEYELEPQTHTGGEATCTEKAECEYCESLYGEEPAGHKYTNACDTECDICNEPREVEGHKYANACDIECDICNEPREVEGHKYANACDTECDICNEPREISHQYGNDGKCSVCGADDPNYQPPSSGTTDNSGSTDSSGATNNSAADNPGSTNNPDTTKDEGLGTGAIVAIVVGAVLVVGGGSFAIIWFVLRKKKLLK